MLGELEDDNHINAIHNIFRYISMLIFWLTEEMSVDNITCV